MEESASHHLPYYTQKNYDSPPRDLAGVWATLFWSEFSQNAVRFPAAKKQAAGRRNRVKTHATNTHRHSKNDLGQIWQKNDFALNFTILHQNALKVSPVELPVLVKLTIQHTYPEVNNITGSRRHFLTR